MDPTYFLRPSSPNIVHEDFEDEMIVVNLETGRYYAFNPSGGEFWGHISRGCQFDTVVQAALLHYDGDPQQIRGELQRFANQLIEENLVAAEPMGASVDAGSGALNITAAGKKPFVPPTLESYTDMQDLLLLDPIHEVDETGWPHPNPDGKPAGQE